MIAAYDGRRSIADDGVFLVQIRRRGLDQWGASLDEAALTRSEMELALSTFGLTSTNLSSATMISTAVIRVMQNAVANGRPVEALLDAGKLGRPFGGHLTRDRTSSLTGAQTRAIVRPQFNY